MRMEFTVGMGRDESALDIAELARTAEDAGFANLTFVDQPNMSRDVFVCMTIAALNTSRIRIGQGVTDPFTYHPSVTANATATVGELSGGRAFVGLGAGGPWGKAMKARPLQELRECIEFIKAYTRGKDAQFRGATMHSEWVGKPLKVYLGGYGPKLCQLAGELADGMMLASNADPVHIKWQLEQIEKGAAKVGRDPSEIDVWARGMIYVADSKDQAKKEVSGYAVNSASALYRHILRQSPEIKDLTERTNKAYPGLLEECKKVHDAWSPDQHERRGTPSSEAITDRIIDIQHLMGTPEDIAEKLETIGELGINTFATVTYTVIDKNGMVKEIGDKVLPYFRN